MHSGLISPTDGAPGPDTRIAVGLAIAGTLLTGVAFIQAPSYAPLLPARVAERRGRGPVYLARAVRLPGDRPPWASAGSANSSDAPADVSMAPEGAGAAPAAAASSDFNPASEADLASEVNPEGEFQGAIHFPDGWYQVWGNRLLRHGQVVGDLIVPHWTGGAWPVVTYHWKNGATHQPDGTLLTRTTRALEGTALKVGDDWWALASSAWVHVGKRVHGHTYPGFELVGGGRLRTLIEGLNRRTRMVRVRRGRRHRTRRVRIATPAIPPGDADMLEKIADVETDGQLDCVSTYDNQVVSFGLRQWTLGSGRLQRFIRANWEAFARYGIAAFGETDQHPEHVWTINGDTVPAIVGVDRPETLTGPYWTARFFRAGQDPQIILAELKLAEGELYHSPHGATSRLGDAMRSSPWFRYSEPARDLLAELENNRPSYVTGVAAATLMQIQNRIGLTEHEFVQLLMQQIARAYEDEFERRAQRAAANQTLALQGPAMKTTAAVRSPTPALSTSPAPLSPAAAGNAGVRFAANWMARVLHLPRELVWQQIHTAVVVPAVALPPPVTVVVPRPPIQAPSTAPAPVKSSAVMPRPVRPAGHPIPVSPTRPAGKSGAISSNPTTPTTAPPGPPVGTREGKTPPDTGSASPGPASLPTVPPESAPVTPGSTPGSAPATNTGDSHGSALGQVNSPAVGGANTPNPGP